MRKEYEEDSEHRAYNEVKIADKDWRIYIAECCLRLVTNDEIILKATDAYEYKTRQIIKVLEHVGVVIDKKYRNIAGGPVFHKDTLKDYVNKKTGRLQVLTVNQIVLIKIPELFSHTELKKSPEEVEKELKG